MLTAGVDGGADVGGGDVGSAARLRVNGGVELRCEGPIEKQLIMDDMLCVSICSHDVLCVSTVVYCAHCVECRQCYG